MKISNQKERLFYLIGETNVRFQQLELYIATYLAIELKLRVKNSTYIMLDSMSYKQKVNLLIELFIQNNNTKILAPKKLKHLLFQAENYRNKVIHSNYGLDEDKWIRFKGNLKAKNGFVNIQKEINFEIMTICSQILYEMQLLEVLDEQKIKEFNDVFESANAHF